MPEAKDGPVTNLFSPVRIKGGIKLSKISRLNVSKEMADAVKHMRYSMSLVSFA